MVAFARLLNSPQVRPRDGARLLFALSPTFRGFARPDVDLKTKPTISSRAGHETKSTKGNERRRECRGIAKRSEVFLSWRLPGELTHPLASDILPRLDFRRAVDL